MSITAFAQVNLRVITRTPLPSELSEWIDDPTVLQVIITNTSTTAFPQATIHFTLTDENGRVLARTKPQSPDIPKINIPAAGLAAPTTTLVLNGSQIIDIDALEYAKSVERTLMMTGSLPEGTYELCLSVHDQNGNNITIGDASCITIETSVPEPPQLLAPIDDEELLGTFPIFRWHPVTGVNTKRSIISYKLKVCPVFSGQSPRDALDRNPVLFERKDIRTSYYQTLPGDLHFDYYPQVRRYAWYVQAFDEKGMPATRNQGKSEVGTFRLPESKSAAPELALQNVYPADNDTLPWSTPQLVVQLLPCTDDIRSVVLQLTVRGDQTSQQWTHTRYIEFPQGPLQTQQIMDPEKAGWLVCNLNDDKSFPVWMNNLGTGKRYTWSVEGTVTLNNGSTHTIQSSATSFTLGFKQPSVLLPANEDTLIAGKQIELSIQFPEPATLNLLDQNVLNNSNFNGFQARAQASAQVLFEIAKSQLFDTLVYQTTVRIPEGAPYVSGDRCEALFQRITRRTDALQDTGMYFWRVRVKDRRDSIINTYSTSFKIVPDSLGRCFDMFIEQPTNNGTWTDGLTPKFAVSLRPGIRKSAITGGRLQIWKMTSSSQNITDAKQSTPVIDTSFTGSTALYAYSTDMLDFTRYDINVVNSDSSSKVFTADSGAYYLWNFTLRYKRDSIRTDGSVCALDSIVSPDGIFQMQPGADDVNKCDGNCFADEPTNKTPGTQTLAKDSVLTIGNFSLTLTSVSGTPASLSGEGTIDVPYLRAPILVEFNNIKVNSNNEVYEGNVFAKIDPSVGYSAASEEDFEGKVLNLAEGVFQSVYNKSKSLGRLVSGLVTKEPVTLPLGYDKDIKGHTTVVGIIGMMFTPTKAVLNAATWVEMPSLGPNAGFGLGAKNICFHKDGIAGKKKAILYLTHDVGYSSDGSWSIFFKAPTPSDSGTYAAWDCSGLEHVVIAAEVEFPRSWLKNINDSTSLVKASFKGRAEKNGDSWQWMLTSSLGDCEISELPGFKVRIPSMVFDFSTTKNPEGIVFPDNYTKDKSTAWKGFFMKSAVLTLPDKFRTFEDVNPEVSMSNVIIDRTGITGKLNAYNVIQDRGGNFGGWEASIDTLRIELTSNSLQYGILKGRIKTALSDTAFEYAGTISRPAADSAGKKSLTYQFSIYPHTAMPIDCFKSTLTLDPSTNITLALTDSGFVGEMTLNGSLTVDSTVEWCSKIGLSGITFSNWKFSTRKPYITQGTTNLASPQHGIAGFPVTINNVDVILGTRDGNFAAALQFTVDVNLHSGSSGVSGATTLKLWGKMIETEKGSQRFVFDGIELDSIGINADFAAVKMRGALSLYSNDPTYGNGFRGTVDATFLEKVTVAATAQFGSLQNHRYWYVDAKAMMPAGIPIVTGAGIYGFAGGAWYGMRCEGTATPPQQDSSANSGNTTASGYRYVPDRNASFGFSAGVVLGTHPSPESFNADVALAAQFTNNGGLGTISFTGNGYMLCTIAERGNAKLRSDANITYYTSTRTLDGVLNVYIQNASPLQGGGRAVFHFDPSGLWYIKIGEPAQPCSLQLASWLNANAYLMVGKELPLPQLPPELQQYQTNIQNRNSNVTNGNGFVFGASQRFQTGRLPYLIFYGDITALYGFDLALLKQEGVSCEGMSGTMGLNGWYATGNIYAYLHAIIGMHVDVWFYEGDKKILDLMLAAILQGGAPNPTWLTGRVSGDYNILGGAVKGHCDYRFSVGEQCRYVTDSPLNRIDLISDMSPNGEQNVDVAVNPQVTFNLLLNEPFEIEEMPEGTNAGRIRTFRVKLDQLSLKKISTNTIVSGQSIEAPDRESAFFRPNEMLEGGTWYRFVAGVSGEERINNAWVPARKRDGSVVRQEETAQFCTSPAPETIREQDIAYSYPVKGQKYFLQGECRSGKIQLIKGMPYLFAPRENFAVSFVARFAPDGSPQLFTDVPLTYNEATWTLSFTIPPLINNTRYTLSIIRKEVPTDPELARLLQAMERTQSSGGIPSTTFTLRERELYSKLGSTVVLTERKAKAGSTLQSGERELYSLSFGTSRFNTLQQKLNTYRQTDVRTERNSVLGGVATFEKQIITFTGTEEFDWYDFVPVRWTSCNTMYTFGPLVKIHAWQRETPWHTQFANPAVYDEISWMKNNRFWQGVVTYERYLNNPLYSFVDVDMSGYQTAVLPLAPSSSANSGKSSGGTTTQTVRTGVPSPTLTLTYNHGIIVPDDYLKLRTRATEVLYNPLITKTNAQRSHLQAILNRNYQPMFRGVYPLRFYYNYNGCRDVDADVPTMYKPFTY